MSAQQDPTVENLLDNTTTDNLNSGLDQEKIAQLAANNSADKLWFRGKVIAPMMIGAGILAFILFGLQIAFVFTRRGATSLAWLDTGICLLASIYLYFSGRANRREALAALKLQNK